MSAPLIGAHYSMLLSYTAGDLLEYVGWSEPGRLADTSVACWRIMKLTYDGADNLITIGWEDGNRKFDNDWDNRAAGSYS